jgi:hypothetical protein
MNRAGLTVCNMLWIGPALGALERACIRSVLSQGHRLVLWCYDLPDGVPEGVELGDASEVVPRTRIIRHHSGSVSLFSNLFRYELQRQGRGTWLDIDHYLLKPIEGEQPYLLTEDEPGRLNNAVLRTPADSPLLPPLIALFEEKIVPPWLRPRARVAAHWRRLLTGRTGLSRMPWGSTGPAAITAVARRLGMAGLAAPPDAYSPVVWENAHWILDPTLGLEEKITPRTIAVHLWNERIKHFKDRPAPAGSFLARLQAEGA